MERLGHSLFVLLQLAIRRFSGLVIPLSLPGKYQPQALPPFPFLRLSTKGVHDCRNAVFQRGAVHIGWTTIVRRAIMLKTAPGEAFDRPAHL